MKQKFSTIFLLLLLLLAGSRVVAQNAPKPFDIEQPSLRVFLPAPELATGRAVVACPGGGYSHLAFEHEGCDWAPYFNKQGIALIVLKYRMPKGDRTLPISDAEAAMKVVRDSADVWNLNPNDIGIMLICRWTSGIYHCHSRQTRTSSEFPDSVLSCDYDG